MSGVNNHPGTPSRVEIWKMFDRIAPRYDLLNRVLSFRRDVAWLRRMSKLLPEGDHPLDLLDLATGTADQALFLMQHCPRIVRALGMDLSTGMLDLGKKKVEKAGLTHRLDLQVGDATKVPVPEASYDLITISFGIRNVTDVSESLANMRRALRPGGRLLVLECSIPTQPVIRAGYLFYFRHILPRIGGLISGDSTAYRYLNETAETFPCGEDFCALMREAGFERVGHEPMTLGVATIYRGDKV